MRDYGLTRICKENDIVFVDNSAIHPRDSLSRDERIDYGLTSDKEAIDVKAKTAYYKNFDHQMKKNRNMLFPQRVIYDLYRELSGFPIFNNPKRPWINYVRAIEKLVRDASRLFLFKPDKDERRDMHVMSDIFSDLALRLGLSHTNYDLVVTANTLAGHGSYIGILSHDFSLLDASQRIASYLGHDPRLQGYFFESGIFVPYKAAFDRPIKNYKVSFPAMKRKRTSVASAKILYQRTLLIPQLRL